MDFPVHEIAECGIDHPVARERRLAAKGLRDDADPEVARAARGSRMADVQMALVPDLELEGLELVDEPLPQSKLARLRAHGGAPSDCAGFTLPFSQSTWGTMNASVAAVMPKTLNFTHRASE